MQVDVNVTWDDIFNGVKGDSANCAIARALKGLGFTHVDVQFETVYLVPQNSDRVHIAALPKPARDFVRAFDGVPASVYEDVAAMPAPVSFSINAEA